MVTFDVVISNYDSATMQNNPIIKMTVFESHIAIVLNVLVVSYHGYLIDVVSHGLPSKIEIHSIFDSHVLESIMEYLSTDPHVGGC